MKKNQSVIISMAVLAMIFMLVGQVGAEGIANAIAAKESGLRKALMKHLKNADRQKGLNSIDGSSLVIYSTPKQYGVAAKFQDGNGQDGNGVNAIAYFNTGAGNGLFTIEPAEMDPATGLVIVLLLREVSSNEEFTLDVEEWPEVDSNDPVIAIDNRQDRRLWCFPNKNGTVKYCTDLDGLPF